MDYAEKRVTVMGLGRFGGGVGVTKFLSSRGAIVTVTDMASQDELADSVAQVRELPNVSLVLGEHREQDFREADLVVANPAVKPTNPFLQIAHDAGVPVTTEIVLLVRELPSRKRTIGITGSAGKSTTTAMVGVALRALFGQGTETPLLTGVEPFGPGVWVGGNLGGSLLPHADSIGIDHWVVLELSSFMLHYLREEKWSPHIAVVTNLSPNHLDWHGTVEEYADAKYGLLKSQASGDVAIVGASLDWSVAQGVRRIAPDEERLGLWDGMALPGRHNRVNAAFAALTVEVAAAKDGRKVRNAIKKYAGLPHRLAYVGKLSDAGEVRCFDDSKSTTPEAAMLGIHAFESGAVHAILGGYDKGSDFTDMCRKAAARCAGVYAVGATGEAIAEAVDAHRTGCIVKCCGTIENAVAAIRQHVKPGDVVLLSPGCASWDQFANYEERGNRFIELVRGDG